MYCSECGVKVSGKFCSECGTRAIPVESPQTPPSESEFVELEPGSDWSQVVEYERLLRYAEVRERIDQAASQSKVRMTGEQFLEFCEKAFAPFGATIPFAAIAKFAQPMGEKLGVKTGRQRTQLLSLPSGQVLVSVLCSMARHGRKLRRATQLSDGCTLDAELPSDLFALAGSLSVTVRRLENGTLLEAATHIPGQWIDWGKSNRCLDQLFGEACAEAA